MLILFYYFTFPFEADMVVVGVGSWEEGHGQHWVLK